MEISNGFVKLDGRRRSTLIGLVSEFRRAKVLAPPECKGRRIWRLGMEILSLEETKNFFEGLQISPNRFKGGCHLIPGAKESFDRLQAAKIRSLCPEMCPSTGGEEVSDDELLCVIED